MTSDVFETETGRDAMTITPDDEIFLETIQEYIWTGLRRRWVSGDILRVRCEPHKEKGRQRIIEILRHRHRPLIVVIKLDIIEVNENWRRIKGRYEHESPTQYYRLQNDLCRWLHAGFSITDVINSKRRKRNG